MEKKVEYNFVTGFVGDVLLSMERSYKVFKSRYRHVKVGITGRDLQERFNDHLKEKGWNRMVVRYRTSSERFANVAEKYFMNKHVELDNSWTGYSPLTDGPYDYVYFLLSGELKK